MCVGGGGLCVDCSSSDTLTYLSSLYFCFFFLFILVLYRYCFCLHKSHNLLGFCQLQSHIFCGIRVFRLLRGILLACLLCFTSLRCTIPIQRISSLVIEAHFPQLQQPSSLFWWHYNYTLAGLAHLSIRTIQKFGYYKV